MYMQKNPARFFTSAVSGSDSRY